LSSAQCSPPQCVTICLDHLSSLREVFSPLPPRLPLLPLLADSFQDIYPSTCSSSGIAPFRVRRFPPPRVGLPRLPVMRLPSPPPQRSFSLTPVFFGLPEKLPCPPPPRDPFFLTLLRLFGGFHEHPLFFPFMCSARCPSTVSPPIIVFRGCVERDVGVFEFFLHKNFSFPPFFFDIPEPTTHSVCHLLCLAFFRFLPQLISYGYFLSNF